MVSWGGIDRDAGANRDDDGKGAHSYSTQPSIAINPTHFHFKFSILNRIDYCKKAVQINHFIPPTRLYLLKAFNDLWENGK